MRRLLSIATVPILVATATLSLQSCSDPGSNSPSSGSSANIITLADGATMAAAKGSRQRAMAEWLTAAGARGSSLDVPPGTFVSGKATLSRAGLGEAATLATLLDATADARIALVVHEHAQYVAASSLGRKRADTGHVSGETWNRVGPAGHPHGSIGAKPQPSVADARRRTRQLARPDPDRGALMVQASQ